MSTESMPSPEHIRAFNEYCATLIEMRLGAVSLHDDWQGQAFYKDSEKTYALSTSFVLMDEHGNERIVWK